MTVSDEIKNKVLKSNEDVHDHYASNHTRAVPYMSRKRTREYMWNLIEKSLKENGIKVRGAKVLEMACGTGTFARLFEKLGAASYDGVDISSEMVRIASQDHPYSGAHFYKDTLEDYSKKNPEAYDIIISSSFLHHLVDLETGILELKKMLKPGGIYLGLHEVKESRPYNKIELLDFELSFLFGYHGHNHFSRKIRLNRFLRFMLPNRRLQFWVDRLSPQKRTEVDYIDYQLNFDFDLENNPVAKKYGKVISYCYYSIAELRHLKKTLNHDLFVMTKEASA